MTTPDNPHLLLFAAIFARLAVQAVRETGNGVVSERSTHSARLIPPLVAGKSPWRRLDFP
jgi:hypothetical protein